MKTLPFFFAATSLFLSFLVSAVPAQATPRVQAKVRDFRPLVAKSVRVAPVSASGSRVISAATREGWDHFDRQQWEKAMDHFLVALETDPTDVSAAEGLTMAVYRSGDRVSAAEIAEELCFSMPWIRGMVAKTLLADVQAELDRGELVVARGIVESLPYGSGAYDDARAIVEGALIESAENSRGAVAASGR